MKLPYKLKNFIWAIRHRIQPQHRYHIVNTGLEPGYYDIDTIILHANMKLLCRYIEDEMGGIDELDRFTNDLKEHPDRNAPDGIHIPQINSQTEASIIYKWWKREWKRDWDDYDKKLDSVYSGKIIPTTDHTVQFEPAINPLCTPEELWQLESDLHNKENEMLKRLIDIRQSLWT